MSNEVNDNVTIIVEGRRFLCRRSVLAKCSSYFDIMFNGGFKEKNENIITLYEMKATTFKNIVHYANNSNYSIVFRELVDTLQCAIMIQFDALKDYCVNRLMNEVKIDYCFPIWFKAEQLDIHPLCEIYKCKSLIEFNYLRKSESILKLNLKELHSYLANGALHCDNELDVFATGMRWYRSAKHLDHATNLLLVILSCIDYNSVTMDEVDEMLLHADVKSNQHIYKLIQDVKLAMNDENAQVSPEARELLTCKKRFRILAPCVVQAEIKPNEEGRLGISRNISVLYYDNETKQMTKLLTSYFHFDSDDLDGEKFIEYKGNILLFGGKYTKSGLGANENVFMYRPLEKMWSLFAQLPEVRKDFETCVIEEKLFIMRGCDGKGKLQESMFFYDFVKGKWSTVIPMPLYYKYIGFCEHKNQLFLMYSNGRLALCPFVFKSKTKCWKPLNVVNSLYTSPVHLNNFILFSDGKYIYLKGTSLIKFEVNNTTLTVQSYQNITPLYEPNDDVKVYAKYNQLFMLVKHGGSDDIISSLYYTNLDTMQTELLTQVKETNKFWLFHKGFFAYFPYSVAKEIGCISDFMCN